MDTIDALNIHHLSLKRDHSLGAGRAQVVAWHYLHTVRLMPAERAVEARCIAGGAI